MARRPAADATSGTPLSMPLVHEQVRIQRGPRSGLPVVVAVHSTVLGRRTP
jgi:hypothetical protein